MSDFTEPGIPMDDEPMQLDLFGAAPTPPEPTIAEVAAKAARAPYESGRPKGVINEPRLKRGKCYRLRRGGHLLRIDVITSIAKDRLGPVADNEPAWSHAYTVEDLDTGERYDKFEAALLHVLDSDRPVRPPKAPAAPTVAPTAPTAPAPVTVAPTVAPAAPTPCCVCQRHYDRPGGWSYAQTFTFCGRVHAVCLDAYGTMTEAWWAVHAGRADVDTGAVLQLLDAPRAGDGWDVDAPIFRAVGHAWHNAGRLIGILRATRPAVTA